MNVHNVGAHAAYITYRGNFIRKVIEPMIEPRHYASSVLDERNDLWVIGGINGSAAADTTEIYSLRQRRWKKGRPLPSFLTHSGLSYHCAVR